MLDKTKATIFSAMINRLVPILLGLGMGLGMVLVGTVIYLIPAMDPHTIHMKDDVDKWEIEQLPIMKSLSKGFRPVYIYSKATPEFMTQYSQEKQDQIIIALTNANDATQNTNHILDRRPFFVDLAANDALILSNTFVLERNGWDGVCIEANPEYWYRLASFRNCTIVGAAVGGD